MQVNFNTNILNSLLSQNPKLALEASVKFTKINDWQTQKTKPTFNQLEELAKYFSVPFGYFFLEKIPAKSYPIPHYRTTTNTAFKPSFTLLETIETLQERQEWARDILIEIGAEPLPFTKGYNLKSPIDKVVNKLHEILDLSAIWCSDIPWSDAFKVLVERAEQAGIFVVVNGVLGNNGRAGLDINEFRGFVLYDEYAPFVFINGKDFYTGKIFSIVHEIVHILIGKSGSFNFDKLMVPDEPVEQFCNAVTAEFLVPEKYLKQAIKEYGININSIARQFRVSRMVVARRLLDINEITKTEFFRHYNTFKQSETTKDTNNSGGDFYNTAPYRVSRKFFSLVYSEVKQNRMLYRDAFRLTGLSPKSFDGYINKYLS